MRLLKLMAVGLVTVAMLVLVGCGGSGGETPEQAVTNALNAIINMDKETAQKYFTYEDFINKSEDEILEDEEMAKLFLKNLSFKVLSSSVEGDTAIVKTEITNTDMGLIFAEYINQAMALAFSNAFSGAPLSEEVIQEQSEQILIGLLNQEDNKIVVSNVDISLAKGENGWNLTMDDITRDALLGGIISVSKGLEDNFGGDSSKNKLQEINNYVISDIWNSGFCDISHFIDRGKNSIGETMDIDFTLSQLARTMEKKTEYDNYISGLSDEEYGAIKQIWGKLSPEIDKLYGKVQTEKPTAQDSSYDFDTGLFSQYQNALSDEIGKLE